MHIVRSRRLNRSLHNAGSQLMQDRARLWLLRLLVHARLIEPVLVRSGRVDEEHIEALGLLLPEEDFERDAEPEPLDRVSDACRESLEELEAAGAETSSTRLSDNVHTLGRLLELEPLDERLLLFFTTLQLEPNFEQILGEIGEHVRGSMVALVAFALDEPESRVEERLGGDGLLIRAGLIASNDHNRRGLDYELLPGFARTVNGTLAEPEKSFRAFFRASPAPELGIDDVPHLADELAILTELLTEARRSTMPGVNILLYGPPGTGKTQLARLLAEQAGLRAREVNHEDHRGEALAGSERQRAYRLCQHLLARDRDGMVIFDEVEDVFESHTNMLRGLFSERRRSGGGGKAWTNDMLETNALPTLWLTNHPEQLDPAYLRRFDYTLEVRTPPRSVRRQILQRACAELPVTEHWLDQTAEADSFTPAEIRGAVRTARLVRGALGEGELEAFLGEQLQRKGRFQGRQPQPPARGSELLRHRLEHLNPETPLEPLIDALGASGEGSLLLYGPPGTGKTALAGAVARRLDRPLLTRPASALLGSYVGQTERQIAAMFKEARDEGAVLLLDEADSLLRSRGEARQSWEVTQTNELLVQMERFPGVFICATNHREVLDSAALRRFDLKLALNALRPEQNRALFGELCAALGLEDEVEPALARRLAALESATPGDYATVGRRFRAQQAGGGTVEMAALVEALEAEQRLKPEAPKRRMGFV